MAKFMNITSFILFVIAIIAVVPQATNAATYNVGDSSGWSIPRGKDTAAFYASWASSNTFNIGDVLVFNFVKGRHDVANVTKETFDTCNLSGLIGSSITDGPASITLNENGVHYFICTFTNHCTMGQKLAVNVGDSSGPAAAPTIKTEGQAPSTISSGATSVGEVSPTSSASSIASAFFAISMSIVLVGLLCQF